jgi:hypothetical protein
MKVHYIIQGKKVAEEKAWLRKARVNVFPKLQRHET